MTRWRRVAAVVAMAGALTAVPVWAADPPAAEESPLGGETAHTHHVHLADGSCVDIDQVTFERLQRGLHRGAVESGTVHHGPCHS